MSERKTVKLIGAGSNIEILLPEGDTSFENVLRFNGIHHDVSMQYRTQNGEVGRNTPLTGDEVIFASKSGSAGTS